MDIEKLFYRIQFLKEEANEGKGKNKLLVCPELSTVPAFVSVSKIIGELC